MSEILVFPAPDGRVPRPSRAPWRCPRCGETWMVSGATTGSAACAACAARAVDADRDRVEAGRRVDAAFREVPATFARWVFPAGDAPPERLIAAWEAHFRGRWPLGTRPPFAPREAPIVLAWGPEGTGKSSLAAVLVAIAVTHDPEPERRGRRLPPTVAWIDAAELAADDALLVAAERCESEHASSIQRRAIDRLERARRADLVVIDDVLSGGRATPSQVERLRLIVSGRLDAGRLTIVTTNLTPTQLKTTHRSLGSRLLAGVVVGTQGPDRRIER